ncbi:hypothetical protein L836_0724 [Mycobacteroides abscessus MAB_110811_2726]|nr:hypothetical protein L836_0724 [Mycobacteroides abscessus MAB_110811_2726]
MTTSLVDRSVYQSLDHVYRSVYMGCVGRHTGCADYSVSRAPAASAAVLTLVSTL